MNRAILTTLKTEIFLQYRVVAVVVVFWIVFLMRTYPFRATGGDTLQRLNRLNNPLLCSSAAFEGV